jgi:hypothetical protein
MKLLGVKGQDARVLRVSSGADDSTVTLYTRAWVWHMFATVQFPDGMVTLHPGYTSQP